MWFQKKNITTFITQNNLGISKPRTIKLVDSKLIATHLNPELSNQGNKISNTKRPQFVIESVNYQQIGQNENNQNCTNFRFKWLSCDIWHYFRLTTKCPSLRSKMRCDESPRRNAIVYSFLSRSFLCIYCKFSFLGLFKFCRQRAFINENKGKEALEFLCQLWLIWS